MVACVHGAGTDRRAPAARGVETRTGRTGHAPRTGDTGHTLRTTRTGHTPRTGHTARRIVVLLGLLHCARLTACGGGSSLGAALVCARAPGLTERQRAMCRQSPAAIAVIGEGLRMAYAECRLQLEGRRWNCSGVGDGTYLGHVMPIATKEAAFTYAITSAGVTHALSEACARGDLPACQCTTNRSVLPLMSLMFTYAITSAGVTHALSEACARGDLPACQCTTNRSVLPLMSLMFTYAITSAGVTHALSEACARGDLPACQCTTNRSVLPLMSLMFTYAITSAGVTHALSEACARGDLPACQCTTNRSVLPLMSLMFTYAITSAGVTHALSEACARGDLPACQCTTNRRRGTSTSEQFEWGGCGVGAYGARLARRFLDARELERDARALMNLHNNRVGRKVSETVKDLVRRECKCHGVSGSCAMRTCWRAPPPFRAVAAALRDRYDRAKLVAPSSTRHARGPPSAQPLHLVLVRRQKQAAGVVRVPRKTELVFLTASPSYCERDDAAGSLGTHHRTCNRTSRGDDGCESLCCGRGYSTVRRVLETKCRCRFNWCCSVSCDTCVARTETHVCN
ncbi:hypothetical protein PYW07_010324 [Mythimna separata]|uniref:Protein Wnt n=1 Tax=Mythimna separata TaxID=271217 RepID=A0AAD7YA55_MYTSE|nr:hypothetical protein PYW07_010324 [Mythimna separata]